MLTKVWITAEQGIKMEQYFQRLWIISFPFQNGFVAISKNMCCYGSISQIHALKSRTMQHSLHADPPNAKYCRSIWYQCH